MDKDFVTFQVDMKSPLLSSLDADDECADLDLQTCLPGFSGPFYWFGPATWSPMSTRLEDMLITGWDRGESCHQAGAAALAAEAHNLHSNGSKCQELVYSVDRFISAMSTGRETVSSESEDEEELQRQIRKKEQKLERIRMKKAAAQKKEAELLSNPSLEGGTTSDKIIGPFGIESP
eukprot:Em0005g1589a